MLTRNKSKVKIGIMQPYFFPYIGYFALIKAVDKFVFYDDVAYIKNGWINRNRIKVGDNVNYITVPVTNASTNYLINKVRIVNYDNFKSRLFKTLEMNYKKASCYTETIGLLTDIFKDNLEYINDLNRKAISKVAKYLGIGTEIITSSSIKKNNELRAEAKVIEICKLLRGDFYINAIGGLDLYSNENFQREGITLKFLRMNDITYMQGKGDFIPNLSIIDVLMWNSKDDVKNMLNNCVLLDGQEGGA